MDSDSDFYLKQPYNIFITFLTKSANYIKHITRIKGCLFEQETDKNIVYYSIFSKLHNCNVFTCLCKQGSWMSRILDQQ